MKFFTKKTVLISFILAVLLSAFALPVSADFYMTDDDVFYQTLPRSYEVKTVIRSYDNDREIFNNPQDLFIDNYDNVFIADTDNNRVVMLDKNNRFIRQFPPKGAKGKSLLNQPNGVYVDGDGDVYVADTENGRVVHYSPVGQFVEEFREPTGETYDKDLEYKPTKLFVDPFGTIYVINRDDWHGIITMTSQGKFICYVGTIKTEYNFQQWFWHTFGTKEQADLWGQIDPQYYLNMTTNGDGTIYATSANERKKQIKRLNPAGENVYADRQYGIIRQQEEDDTDEEKHTSNLPRFTDLAVDNEGMVFACDAMRAEMYIYDQVGNNNAVFGDPGDTERAFGLISGLELTSTKNIYVLDAELGTIQVMEPTDFMREIIIATTLYNNGKYSEALVHWDKVLAMDTTYKQAQIGRAKSLLNNKQYGESLALYRKAYDKGGYSAAFEMIRKDVFKTQFGWIVLGVVVIVILAYIGIGKMKKQADKISDRPAPEDDKWGLKFFWETIVCVIFHPMDAFYKIKYNRKSLKVWPVILMILILVVEKILFRQLIHYPLSDNAVYIDYGRDLLTFFLPLLSWVVVAYAISSISDGKQTFMETASSTLYSFIPFMFLYIPITAVSNAMATGEAAFYNGLQIVVLLWCLILVYLNFKILNEYSFGKAVWTIIKTLFAMLCLWIIIFLFYIVVTQLFSFIGDLYTEAVYITR